ncbi:uncharacterized protein LOC143729397 isoform X1 [Siphateles boraxobius]|uniref:uncharacterized protein LOC143729397 isoform X1 n=1 Tax=Siphateles boraxobius TaxID=180520 RepID=UPI004064539E
MVWTRLDGTSYTCLCKVCLDRGSKGFCLQSRRSRGLLIYERVPLNENRVRCLPCCDCSAGLQGSPIMLQSLLFLGNQYLKGARWISPSASCIAGFLFSTCLTQLEAHGCQEMSWER